jgi:3-phytase
MKHLSALPLTASLIALLAGCASPRDSYPKVHATIETTPVTSPDDAADDPAIWVNPADPARSLVIGTDKQRGLVVYRLDGEIAQSIPVGRVNNVDLRAGVVVAGRTIDLVAASNRTDNSVVLYEVQPGTGALVPLAGLDRFPTGLVEVYGFCLRRDPASGAAEVFVGEKAGPVQHYRLGTAPDGKPAARLLRTIPFASQTEGMVSDDDRGVIYVGEEKGGVWMVPAAGEDISLPPIKIIDVRPHSSLVPDVEGISIFRVDSTRGYLLVSSQGDHSFAVFDRQPPNAYLGSFIVGPGGKIDGAEETDGLDVSPTNFGPGFARGMLVVQDGFNAGGNQNFKYIPWAEVERALNLPR